MEREVKTLGTSLMITVDSTSIDRFLFNFFNVVLQVGVKNIVLFSLFHQDIEHLSQPRTQGILLLLERIGENGHMTP